MKLKLKIISAGAGSGKTYRLTEEMVALLKTDVRASGIIATTFTKKAAAELQERVRVRLLEEGLNAAADDLSNALIGTVHGLGVKLLRRFAFEAGVSPVVDIIADEDQQSLFNKSLATVLNAQRIRQMESLSDRLGLTKKERYDWRTEVKNLTDVARANDFSIEVLEKSKRLSFEHFQQFLAKASNKTEAVFYAELNHQLAESIERLQNNEDETKVTQTAINVLRGFQNTLKFKTKLNWHEWVKISKIKVGAKSKEDVAALVDFAQTHETNPAFHQDVQDFINSIFDIAIEAINEYEAYKQQRGLIDYIDMESQVKRLLDHPQVQEVLKEELDLLMVDEFQDTNPIQLEIFLKLSQIAKHSIWVGDPKQSIYGFRGADPKLMQAIITQNGGVQPEDIQIYSWRSREDIVYATNALFTKAFPNIPAEQVALKAKRRKKASPETQNKTDEPINMGDALIHWHFEFEGGGKRLPGRPWMENCIAVSIEKMLEEGCWIFPKGEKDYRKAKPGDVAVLCRSNAECLLVAEALHRTGLKAAIARNGLLATAESTLILACLKFILNKTDALSVAEILKLAANEETEDIIKNRLQYLAENDGENRRGVWWADEFSIINALNELRREVLELSSTEILNLVIEELDLRRIIAQWGKVNQRLANVDMLRKLALQYEENCNRLHTAASLGGFLLWLNELVNKGEDMQGSAEGIDAVNVLTYHRSKGLEWPIVICHSLEGTLREQIFGISIVSETEEVDLNNVLGNRWLRYWVNPYADQKSGTKLMERLDASPAKAAVHEQALAEEARLLYVGITRARDYLIFPTRGKPSKWLNRVWHRGEEDHPTLDVSSHESPWEWESNFVNIEPRPEIYPKDFGWAEITEKSIPFSSERTGKKEEKAYHIDVTKENLDQTGAYETKLGQATQYHPPMKLKKDLDLAKIAKATKAFFTADFPTEYEAEARLTMARDLLLRYEVDDFVEAMNLLQATHSFEQHLQANFKIEKIYRKYPVQVHWQGRLFETMIDFIFKTERGYVLIQHSAFTGAQKKWKQKSLELGGWMFLAKKALRNIFQTETVDTYVHFVLTANLVELKIRDTIFAN